MKFTKTPLLFILFVMCFLSSQAQHDHDHPRTCHTVEAENEMREKYPELGTLEDFENWLRPHVAFYKNSAQNRAVTTIPVIFHIIHDNDAVGSGDNLSATYINAQIDQLNNDFRKIAGTSGDNNNPVGADSEIEFCAAVVDPNGATLAEAGINRINRSAQGWTATPYGTCTNGNFGDAYIENTIKPQSQWDPNNYFNIWVMDISCGILGYAQFPSQSGLPGLNSNGGAANTDGVVLLTTSVGSTTTPNPAGGVYNEGRTATHEVGHFLGLRHIWGDATCGNDYCDDTPAASGPASGCPTKTTCDGVQDMVENYMDYSYDDCMNVFTVDQKARMQAVLANSPRRGSLGNSTACSTSGGGCSNTITAYPYTESFENSFGAWTQGSGDDFDWARRSGSTPSSNTGPSSASAGSFYAYVEASSPNYPSKTTLLQGPCFDLSSLSNPSLTFDYHMYGSAVGTLSLEVKTSGGSWTSVWSRSGDQGNSWFATSVDLSAYTGSTVELRYVGATAASWAGDMAIDNLNLSSGSGGGSACSGGIASFPYAEGFENSFGDWTQDNGDDFDWTRRSGSTPSSNTGPSSANEGSFYAYMESSTPNYSNKTAILNGPCYDLSAENSATFSFDYHMYGATNMGSLELQAKASGNSSWSAVWSQSGNQGNAWQTANVDLAAYLGGSVELRFYGVTGTTWQGDMAIDNLSLSSTGGGGGCSDVTLTIVLDNYPEETSWEITSGGTTIASGGTYGSQPDGSTVTITECLDAGCYDFTIFDSYGDGICCSYGNGSYSLEDASGTVLASGGSFGSSETTNFCVSSGNRVEMEEARFVQEGGYDLFLFPNPTSADLNVNYESARAESVQIRLVDLMGRTLQVQNWEVEVGENQQRLDVSNLGTGTFMLIIAGEEQLSSKRFVVNQ